MPLAQSGNATLPSRFPFGWIAQPWPGWSGLGPSLLTSFAKVTSRAEILAHREIGRDYGKIKC